MKCFPIVSDKDKQNNVASELLSFDPGPTSDQDQVSREFWVRGIINRKKKKLLLEKVNFLN